MDSGMLNPASTFFLGDWLVDPSANRLRRRNTSVILEPKVMDVLVVLARHAGDTVTRTELLEGVWPDCFVEPGSLNRCISRLRSVLDDPPGRPQFIETVRKRGYRLIAPVNQKSSGLPTSTRPSVNAVRPALARIAAREAGNGEPWTWYVSWLSAAV